jgi:hypothetical protein
MHRKKIISFFQSLIEEGCSSFIIFIYRPLDYKIVELLYFIQQQSLARFSYTLIFFRSETGISYDWLDDELNASRVIQSAKKVIWRRSLCHSQQWILKILEL